MNLIGVAVGSNRAKGTSEKCTKCAKCSGPYCWYLYKEKSNLHGGKHKVGVKEEMY